VTTPRTPPRRLAVSPTQAAEMLGMGRSTFYRDVLPELRVVHHGRRTLIPIRELDAWLERNSAQPLVEP
jgi:excisionase family DNA binding protein